MRFIFTEKEHQSQLRKTTDGFTEKQKLVILFSLWAITCFSETQENNEIRKMYFGELMTLYNIDPTKFINFINGGIYIKAEIIPILADFNHHQLVYYFSILFGFLRSPNPSNITIGEADKFYDFIESLGLNANTVINIATKFLT